MQIGKLELTNWMTHHHLELDLAPLTLIAGGNDRGKSSIRDAIAFALIGESPRIESKAERVDLITEGQGRGAVALTIGDWRVSRNVKDGKATTKNELSGAPSREVMAAVLPFVLTPGLFAASTPDQRRAVLMKAMRREPTAAKIKELLTKRGVTPERLEKLPDGRDPTTWPAHAEQLAAEARGAWKEITGEAYGAVKAADWKAPVPDAVPLADDIAALQHAVSTAQTAVQTAEAAQSDARVAERVAALVREHGRGAADLAGWEARLAELPALIASAVAAEVVAEAAHRDAGAEMLATEARLPGASHDCPHCKGKLTIGNGKLLAFKPPENPATELEVAAARRKIGDTARAIEDASLDLSRLEREKRNLETDIRGAKAKQAEVAAAQAAEPSDGPSLEVATAAVEAARRALVGAREELVLAEAAVGVATSADKRSANAAAAHADVVAWLEVRDMVAPGGIPAELLGGALKPFLTTLAEFAADTGWPQVTLGADMSIRSGGKPYKLCGESRQWRADAMIAMALSGFSGLGLVVLDRADILEVPDRGVLLSWLLGLLGGGLDTALVFATLQAPPSTQAEGFKTVWLGTNADAEQEQAA